MTNTTPSPNIKTQLAAVMFNLRHYISNYDAEIDYVKSNGSDLPMLDGNMYKLNPAYVYVRQASYRDTFYSTFLAEQREIKQQIREEEKARKEMEKAIKEAEKEERLIQKALEKARAELANANEEQRKEFEAQLADLEGKLEEAEERGQRALSMAQQTRRGHVYVISNVGSFGENVFKIGMTRRLEPLDRVKELGDASVPFSFDVHAMLYSEDAPTLEKELHRRFNRESVNKVNPRKEFFRTSLAEIKQMVDNQGIADVHWTMKAEAAEYRESLAIEAAQQEENVA